MSKLRERRALRLFAPDKWDLPGTESWLTSMAAKGLHFCKKRKNCTWFAKGPPKAVRYRLDAVSPFSPTPDPERQAQAEEMGWTYVTQLDDFSLYLCENPDAPELHTDPVTQSYTMDALADAIEANLVLISFALFVAALFIAFSFYTSIFSLPNLIQYNADFAYLILLVAALFSLIGSLIQAVRLLGLRRRLRAGLSIEHRTGYSVSTWFSSAGQVCLSLGLLMILVTLTLTLSAPKQWDITVETPSPISFGLAELENSANYAPTHTNFRGWNSSNHVYPRPSLLSPTQYTIMEHGEIPGRYGPDGRVYSPHWHLQYYRPLPFLVKPLADSLLAEDIKRFSEYAKEELSAPAADRAVIFTSPDATRKILLLWAGGQVLRADYSGNADLAGALPALVAALP